MNETHDFGIQKGLEKSREDLTLRVKVIETDCVSSPLYIYRYPSGSSAPAYNSRVYNASNQLRWQTVQTRWNLEISRNIVHRLPKDVCFHIHQTWKGKIGVAQELTIQLFILLTTRSMWQEKSKTYIEDIDLL